MLFYLSIIFGGLFGLLSIGLLLMLIDEKKLVAIIKKLPTRPINSLGKPGLYEIQGVVRCEDPLYLKEWGPEPLVYYEINYYEIKRVDNETETNFIETKTDCCNFNLEDLSGKISVLPGKAEIVSNETREKEVTIDDQNHSELYRHLATAFKIKPRAFKYDVKALLCDRPLFALGCAEKVNGELTFSKEDSEPFLLSSEREKVLLKKKQESITSSIGCLGFSVLITAMCVKYLFF